MPGIVIKSTTLGGGGGGGGSLTIGTIDSQTPAANGAVASSSTLYLQSASATFPGLVNISAQTFAGVKTFASAPNLSSLTASTALILDGSKNIASSVTTSTELGYVSGVTSAIQTQLNGKQATGNYITALTADVTATGPGSVAATIASNVVTNAKLAQMPTLTIKGNNTGGTANALDLTVAQVNAILPVFTSTLNGLVPLSGGGTVNFLRADGTFAVPPGTGVTSVALSVPATSILSVTGSPITTSGTIALATTGTSGGIPYFSSTSQLATSALLAANQIVLGGGAATAPATLGSLGTTTTVLHGNAAGAPTFGAVSLTADVSGILPIANGGTAVSSVTTAPTATAFAGWDANSNLSARNHIEGYTSTATAAGTTTLTVSSNFQQVFTGSTTQTVVLPVVSTLVAGMQYQIVNLSSGVVTVQSSGANTIQAMAANTILSLTCISTSGTGTASWNWTYGSVQSTALFGGFVAPTVQRFTSGSGTYTTPTSPRAPLYIVVELVGGGGGGSGSGTSPGAATAGNATTFGSSFLTAGGGSQGVVSGGSGGAGGTNTINAGGTTLVNAVGGSGSGAIAINLAFGGSGGNSVFGGGAGGAGSDTAGTAGATNTGGGGSGGGTNSASTAGGTGGGAGGYVKVLITSPSATYSYAVGAAANGGTAGTNGRAGGAGASGIVIVTEYYQ